MAGALLIGGAVACGSSVASPEGARDAAPTDAEVLVDSGSEDPARDGGAPDATRAVPRANAPALPCADAMADVYVTPAGLPPMTDAERGHVVRCAHDVALGGAQIDARLASAGATGITRTSETTLYRLAFRTFRNGRVAGVSTARVYLPTMQRPGPLPVVVVAHPTVGLADACVPSADPTSLDDLALPWAARGFAVIAPDYAGLGNEGVQGYVQNHDTAHSLLDGARALRAWLPEGALDDRVLLVGYSQGGGAVLAAQGLARTYGAGGDVVAAVVFAPEYFARLASFGWLGMLRAPDALTITTGISKPVVAAYRGYAAAYNVLGPASAGLTFPEEKRDGLVAAAEAQCQTPFGGYVQAVAPHLRDLFDEAFRTAMLACVDGAPGCTGIASQLHAWLASDLVAPDPAGAPVLYVQGLLDVIMPAAEEAACNVPLLVKAGVHVQTCLDGAASHTSVVPRNVAFALAWSEAKLDGAALPTCAGGSLPACAN